jgi:hypothetical protein
MISEYLVYAYIANWLTEAILTISIRSRMKKYHPVQFERLFAKTISEHTIEKSLIYVKYSFSSSEWPGLNDATLSKLLHLSRVTGFFVIAPLALFFGALVLAILYEIWVAF